MTPEQIARLSRRILGQGGTLERTGGTGLDSAAADATRVAKLTAAIENRLVAEATATGTSLAPGEASLTASGIATRAHAALSRLEQGEPVSSLSNLEMAHLEAIVLMSGRPALRYPEEHLEDPEKLPENKPWEVVITLYRKKIEALSAAVGCIQIEPPGRPPEPLGTGWRVGSKLIVTNRHVVEQMAANASAPPDQWKLRTDMTMAIDFAAVHKTPGPRRQAIAAVSWCAQGGPDLALLEITSSGGVPASDLLTIDWDMQSLGSPGAGGPNERFQGRKVYVVGHPYWPEASGPVAKVFGKADGKKRWSPGCVTRLRPGSSMFEHDCSTLPGNSGSCVVSVDFHRVVGLHFTGINTDATGRGTANAAVSFARLVGTTAGDRLKGVS
jgi:hypothetical protein